jgi:two-component system sensor histidine kinase DegS
VVADNGTGFDPSEIGDDGGLMNLRDRLDSVRGTLTVESRVGSGTTIVAVVPRIKDAAPDHGRTQALHPVA